MPITAQEIAPPIDELLREYFRLLRAGRCIERFELARLQSTWLAKIAVGKTSHASNKLSRSFVFPDGVKLRAEVDNLLDHSKINKKAIHSAIRSICRKKTYSDDDRKKMLIPIIERHDAIKAEATRIPKSLSKARSYLVQTAIELTDLNSINANHSSFTTDNETIRSLLSDFREDGTRSPALGYETEHGVAWHRFLSRFGAGEAKAAALSGEIENNLKRALDENISDLRDAIHDRRHHNALSPALLVWSVNRSVELSRTLRVEMTTLIQLISHLQGTDGSWRVPHWAQGDHDLTCQTTAFCLLGLARSNNRALYEEQMRRASSWLCAAQANDGSWTASGGLRAADKPDLLTTVVSQEAIFMASQSFISNVERARGYILQCQEPLGDWNYPSFSPEFATALAVESFDVNWPDVLPHATNEHLRMAREFLPGGEHMLAGTDPADLRLGIIALYHGLEALLHGCFVQPHLNIPIWRQQGQTISLREALSAYREHIRSIKPTNSLQYEQQMRDLASLRDNIVHRSAKVTKSEALEAVRDASGFVRSHAGDLLPRDVAIGSIWPGIS